MNNSQNLLFMSELIDVLKETSGVQAIVLGGSRAKGTHHLGSDYDLGLYYDRQLPPDIHRLNQIAKQVDDRKLDRLLTPIGEWGPWINGGGWLKINSESVDLMYRDLNQVQQVIQDCLNGNITISYQPGHPHGFVSSIYWAEVALCQVIWEKKGVISTLKEKTLIYSPVLKRALFEKFLWEVDFSLMCAKKGFPYQDLSYIAGICFRAVSCLNQAIFAMNEQYWMNEKGAVRAIESMTKRPPNYENRVRQVFSEISSQEERLDQGIQILTELKNETVLLLSGT